MNWQLVGIFLGFVVVFFFGRLTMKEEMTPIEKEPPCMCKNPKR